MEVVQGMAILVSNKKRDADASSNEEQERNRVDPF
jgi:hypothetical protein